MSSLFERVATYGEPVFVAPCDGPLWRHGCGWIVGVDLLAGRFVPPVCEHCRACGPWLPLFAYIGPLCDQCHGNGWVPIAGNVDGAFCGFETVTECTACGSSGVASSAQLTGGV